MEKEINQILDILDNTEEQNFSNFDMDIAHKQNEALTEIYGICVRWKNTSSHIKEPPATVPQQPLCGSQGSPKLPSFEEYLEKIYLPHRKKEGFCNTLLPVARNAMEFTWNFLIKKLGNFT